LLTVSLLGVSALGVLAAPAGASGRKGDTAAFCAAASNLGGATASQPTKDQAKALRQQFKDAGKDAPPKVKAAIVQIRKYLGVLAAGDRSGVTKAAKSENVSGYAGAVATFTSYVATNCG
jgi:hypothetical protein